MTENEERAAVVREALTWVNTPYVDGAKVKGAGVDCGRLIEAVFSDLGLIPPTDPGYYSPQHHMHSKEERYLGFVQQFAEEIPGPPLPGDVVMFKFGYCFSHGGIVIEWPRIVHALRFGGATIVNVEMCKIGPRALNHLERKYFSLWSKKS